MTYAADEQTDSADSVRKTPERILESARHLFRQKGFERTSMNDIAGQVGISAPSVYWHFPSKEVILYSILRAQIEDFYMEIQHPAGGADPAARLKDFVRLYVRYQLDRLDQAREFTYIYGLAQLSHALTEDHLKSLRDTERAITVLIKDILDEGQNLGLFVFDDLSVTAFAIITMCENVTSWAKPGGRALPHEIAEMLGKLVLRMVSIESALHA